MEAPKISIARKHSIQQSYNCWGKHGLVVVIFLLLIGLSGCTTLLLMALKECSRSPWIKSDAHKVSPQEQLACTKEVQAQANGHTPSRVESKAKVESCMIAKGYQRRPWWRLNDMECHR